MLILVLSHQVPVNAFHRLPRSQAQHQVRVGHEVMRDNARDEVSGSFLVILYDDFHFLEPARGTGRFA